MYGITYGEILDEWIQVLRNEDFIPYQQQKEALKNLYASEHEKTKSEILNYIRENNTPDVFEKAEKLYFYIKDNFFKGNFSLSYKEILCNNEREVVKGENENDLNKALSLLFEVEEEKHKVYDDAVFDKIAELNYGYSKNLMNLLQKYSDNPEKLGVIDEVLQCFGCISRDLIFVMGQEILEELRGELKDVIDASEGDHLTMEQAEELDNEYYVLLSKIDLLENINKNSFEGARHNDNKNNSEIEKEQENATDIEIEKLWEDLTDVPIDEDECLDVDWQGWSKGTHREEIWYWFDEHHSKGVGWLMNEYEPKSANLPSEVAKSVYSSTEEITKSFIEDGWSNNTSFSELTLEEAREKGYLWAVEGINKGRKYFKMNICGNIFDDRGKLVFLNLNNQEKSDVSLEEKIAVAQSQQKETTSKQDRISVAKTRN